MTWGSPESDAICSISSTDGRSSCVKDRRGIIQTRTSTKIGSASVHGRRRTKSNPALTASITPNGFCSATVRVFDSLIMFVSCAARRLYAYAHSMSKAFVHLFYCRARPSRRARLECDGSMPRLPDQTDCQPQTEPCRTKRNHKQRHKTKQIQQGPTDDGDKSGDAQNRVCETDIQCAFFRRREIQQVRRKRDICRRTSNAVHQKNQTECYSDRTRLSEPPEQ